MLRSNVLVTETLGFLGCVGQDALAFVRKRQVDRGGDLFADGGCAPRFACGSIPPKRASAGKRLVSALSSRRRPRRRCSVLNCKGGTELAGLVSREEDDSPWPSPYSVRTWCSPLFFQAIGCRVAVRFKCLPRLQLCAPQCLMHTMLPEAPLESHSCPEQLLWMVSEGSPIALGREIRLLASIRPLPAWRVFKARPRAPYILKTHLRPKYSISPFRFVCLL